VNESGDKQPTASLAESISQATPRIEELIGAAERIAQEIRDDAKAAGDRYVDERRREANRITEEHAQAIVDLTNSLVEPVDKLRDHAHAVGMELAQAADRLRELSATITGTARERVNLPSPRTDDRAAMSRVLSRRSNDLEAAEGALSELDVSKEAVLRATQMAIVGSGRDEIEHVLRLEFKVAEPGAVVDEVLGSNPA
jgi:ABC-type transporter Mla subunit MlaD